ncbi:T9SS type A sorting domain-containing protein [bacterium]|nr:T9SS type A sorting domain-containing protein [bacterium]
MFLYPTTMTAQSSTNLMLEWNTFFGGVGTNVARATVVDAQDNIYVVGLAQEGWDNSIIPFSGGSKNGFLAKFSSSGALLWHTYIPAAGASLNDVTIDDNGNIIAIGSTTANWGNPVNQYTSGGMADIQVVKFNSSGSLIWNTFAGGYNQDFGESVALDADGNIYITGYCWGYPGWGAPIREHSSSSSDHFVAKLNSDGEMLWNTFLGGDGFDANESDISVTGDGMLYVAGAGNASWGNPVQAFSASMDVFVAALDSSGGLVWNTFVGGAGDDRGIHLAVDGDDNIFLVGHSSATWGTPIVAWTEGYLEEMTDAFAAKVSKEGYVVWNTFLGGGSRDDGREIIRHPDGTLYIVGQTYGVSWGTPLDSYDGGSDCFLAAVDTAGQRLWNTFIGSNIYDGGWGIAFDSNYNLVVCGTSYASWGDPINPHNSPTSLWDGFLALLVFNHPPVANCHASMTVAATGTCTAYASMDNGSSDPDDNIATITQTPPGPYPIGTTEVNLTVTDTYGVSSTCTGYITVIDNSAPAVISKAASVTLVDGAAEIMPDDVDGGSIDACSAFSLSVSPNTFTCLNIGANTVTLTAVDAHNNVATTTATVNVIGAVPDPVIEVAPSPTVLNHAENTVYLGFGPQTVTLTASGSQSDTYEWAASPRLSSTDIKSPTFAVSEAGAYTESVTVTNEYGCTGSASISIEVLDWRCNNNANQVKIMMCHEGKTICVAENAVQAHLGLGDYIGACQTQKQRSISPEFLSLAQNRPNPFNPTTWIEYSLPEAGMVRLVVYNLLGQEIYRLVDNYSPAGIHHAVFDGSDLPTGTYIYRLEWNGQTLTRRMARLK